MTDGAAEHHVDLARGWKLWRWVLVRAAGFPAAGVLELADASAADAADRSNALATQVGEQRARAANELAAAVSHTDPHWKAAGKVLRALRRGDDVGAVPDELAAASPSLLRLSELAQQLAAQLATYQAAYAAALAHSARVARRWAGDPLFREAIAWQNRHALPTALDRLLADGSSNSKARQHEQLVATYLQRYCTKNDTIGFFGPILWGRFGDRTHVTPGSTLLARREVYFETWAIDRLATIFGEDRAILEHVAPRRMPSIYLDGDVLIHGLSSRSKLPPSFAQMLAACDGIRTAAELATTLPADGSGLFDDTNDVYAHLDELVRRKFVVWRVDVPVGLIRPERGLRAILESVGDAGARSLAILDELEARRHDVAAAAGDAAAVTQALEQLDATFERITQGAARRRAGEMYAGRTLVYEDTSRDLGVTLGRSLASRMGPAMTLVLASARWFTFEIAKRTRAKLEAIYDDLASESGQSMLDYVAYYARAAEVLPDGTGGAIVEEVREELQRRWIEVLQLDLSAKNVTRASTDLVPAVETAFAAPHPGWPWARFHSPDLMVAARSVEELEHGRPLVVFGELHVGVNTQLTPLFFKDAAEPDAMLAAQQADIADPPIEPVHPPDLMNRAVAISVDPRGLQVELTTARAWRPPAQTIAARELVVERRDGRLRVRTRDGRHDFDVIAFFEHQLLETTSQFSLMPRQPHMPRITIDDVVIAREQWRFAASDIACVRLDRGPELFAAVRHWAQSMGLPRYVFLKIPEETKPVYVDFASPTYVDAFAKLVRKASNVAISEMLPGHGELWLPDAAGNTYTSELRLVAADPVAWEAP